MKLGEAMYKEQQAEAEAAGPSDDSGDGTAGPGSQAGDEEVVDADFEEVDDDKKGKTA